MRAARARALVYTVHAYKDSCLITSACCKAGLSRSKALELLSASQELKDEGSVVLSTYNHVC
jgi:hypothetical protein